MKVWPDLRKGTGAAVKFFTQGVRKLWGHALRKKVSQPRLFLLKIKNKLLPLICTRSFEKNILRLLSYIVYDIYTSFHTAREKHEIYFFLIVRAKIKLVDWFWTLGSWFMQHKEYFIYLKTNVRKMYWTNLKRKLKVNSLLLNIPTKLIINRSKAINENVNEFSVIKQINFASKRTLDYFRKKYPEYANNWLVSQIAVRAETVNVTAHRVGCNT